MSNSDEIRTFSGLLNAFAVKHLADVHNTEAGWAEIGEELVLKTEGSVLLVVNLADVDAPKGSKTMESREYGTTGSKTTKRQTLYDNTSVPTDDILNLQYFFPYCDRFLKANRGGTITLLICGNNNDIARASCYLLAQSKIRPRLRIYCASADHFVSALDDCPDLPVRQLNYDSEDIGSLFPLLRVGTPLTTARGQQEAAAIPSQILSQSSPVFYEYIKNNYKTYTQDSQLGILFDAGYHQF